MVRLVHNVGLVQFLSFFKHQVVGSSNVIVPVRFNALNRVVSIEAELLEHLLIHCVIQGHELFLGE